MDRMFPMEYVMGYTAALQDVLKTFEQIQVDLKFHKRQQSYKTYKAIVECMLQNRIVLRENPDAFVRCNNNAESGFELYVEGHGVYHAE